MAEPFFRAMAERAVTRNPPTASDFYAEGEASPAEGSGGKKPGRKGLNPLLIIAPAAAQALDAYTTQAALRRNPSLREGNSLMEPFVNNPGAMYAAKVGTGLAVGLLADRLARSGHKNMAKILAGVDIGVPVAAAISNASKGAK